MKAESKAPAKKALPGWRAGDDIAPRPESSPKKPRVKKPRPDTVKDSFDAQDWSTTEIEKHDWLRNAYVNQKAAVDWWDLVAEAYHFVENAVFQGTTHWKGRDSETIATALAGLRGMLYERRVQSERNAFALGSFVEGADAEIRQMVVDRFIKEGYEVMHLLDRHGEYPGSYLSSVSDEIIKQAAARVKKAEAKEASLEVLDELESLMSGDYLTLDDLMSDVTDFVKLQRKFLK